MPKSTHSRIVREGARLLPDHIAQAHREAAAEQAAEDGACDGHESLNGPIGNIEYCDGTCRPTSSRRVIEADQDGLEPEQVGQYGEDDVPGSELSDDDLTSAAETAGPSEMREVPDDDSAGLRIEVTIGSTCACGCGDKTSAGRSFVQGHDQRLIGLLAANHAQEIQFSDGGMLITTDAIGYAARVFSPAGLAKLGRAIDRAKIAPATPRSVVRTAHQAPAEPATALGAEVTVKVGRHTYPATVAGMNQAGKITAVQYVQKTTGATRVAQEGSFSLV